MRVLLDEQLPRSLARHLSGHAVRTVQQEGWAGLIIAEGVIAPELVVQAVDQALRRGLIMRRRLETARVSTRVRQRIDRILKQVDPSSLVELTLTTVQPQAPRDDQRRRVLRQTRDDGPPAFAIP